MQFYLTKNMQFYWTKTMQFYGTKNKQFYWTKNMHFYLTKICNFIGLKICNFIGLKICNFIGLKICNFIGLKYAILYADKLQACVQITYIQVNSVEFSKNETDFFWGGLFSKSDCVNWMGRTRRMYKICSSKHDNKNITLNIQV